MSRPRMRGEPVHRQRRRGLRRDAVGERDRRGGGNDDQLGLGAAVGRAAGWWPPSPPGRPRARSTPSPTDSTVPAASIPGVHGGGTSVLPRVRVPTSVGLTAAKRTRMRTSPAAGSRTGRSMTRRTSGPPGSGIADCSCRAHHRIVGRASQPAITPASARAPPRRAPRRDRRRRPDRRSSASARCAAPASPPPAPACGTRSRCHRRRLVGRRPGEQQLLVERGEVRGVVDVQRDVHLRLAERPAALAGVGGRRRMPEPRLDRAGARAAPGVDLDLVDRGRQHPLGVDVDPDARDLDRGLGLPAEDDVGAPLGPHPPEAGDVGGERVVGVQAREARHPDPGAAHQPHRQLAQPGVLHVQPRHVLDPARDRVQAQPPGRPDVADAGPAHVGERAHVARPRDERLELGQAGTVLIASRAVPTRSFSAAAGACSSLRLPRAAWIARQTRSPWRACRYAHAEVESASITAFSAAGVEPIVPDSPIPFAPSGLTGVGVSMRDVLELGNSAPGMQ